MVGQSYGSGVTKELAEKLGVLDTAEGMEPRGPDTPMKAVRAADVPKSKSLFKLLMSGLSDEEPDEGPDDDTEAVAPVAPVAKVCGPASKWDCLKMLLCIFMRAFGTDASSDSGQFRPPDSGQFRGQ
jgi:hypothetical protein